MLWCIFRVSHMHVLREIDLPHTHIHTHTHILHKQKASPTELPRIFLVAMVFKLGRRSGPIKASGSDDILVEVLLIRPYHGNILCSSIEHKIKTSTRCDKCKQKEHNKTVFLLLL